MKRKVFSVIGLVVVAIGVYSFVISNQDDIPIETKTQNIKELVHDYSVGNIKEQSASITSQQLIVTNSDDRQLIYDLPKDDFFVSIAPYVRKHTPVRSTV